MEDLKDLVDNGTTYVSIRHMIKSDFSGNQGRDMCLEYFGEEDDECREHNKKYELSK